MGGSRNLTRRERDGVDLLDNMVAGARGAVFRNTGGKGGWGGMPVCADKNDERFYVYICDEKWREQVVTAPFRSTVPNASKIFFRSPKKKPERRGAFGIPRVLARPEKASFRIDYRYQSKTSSDPELVLAPVHRNERIQTAQRKASVYGAYSRL